MRNKLLLIAALLLMLTELTMSSCTMRGVSGNPYVWHTGRRTHRHFGAHKHYNGRKAIWGRHHYGPRQNSFRGRYR